MGTEILTTEFNSPLTEREMEWARIIVHRRLDEKKTEEVRAIFDRMDMSHEALRARLAEVEKERDDWKAAAATAAETRDSWAAECHKAEDELDAVQADLGKVNRERDQARGACNGCHRILSDARAKADADSAALRAVLREVLGIWRSESGCECVSCAALHARATALAASSCGAKVECEGCKRMRGALGRAYADCRILAHSYEHDSRPPGEIVKRCLALPVNVMEAVDALSAPKGGEVGK